MADAESLQQLREAVGLSPKNLPLRHALADALMAAGYEQTCAYLAQPDALPETRSPLPVSHWWQTMLGKWQTPGRSAS